MKFLLLHSHLLYGLLEFHSFFFKAFCHSWSVIWICLFFLLLLDLLLCHFSFFNSFWFFWWFSFESNIVYKIIFCFLNCFKKNLNWILIFKMEFEPKIHTLVGHKTWVSDFTVTNCITFSQIFIVKTDYKLFSGICRLKLELFVHFEVISPFSFTFILYFYSSKVIEQ